MTWIEADAINVLCAPEHWRLVAGPDLPAEAEPIDRRQADPRRQHRHPFPEAMIALQGETRFGVGDEIYSATPGTVFFLGDTSVHDSGYFGSGPDFDHLWISFEPRRIRSWIVRQRIASNGIHAGPSSQHVPCDLGIDLERFVLQQGLGLQHPARIRRAKIYATLASVAATIAERMHSYQPDSSLIEDSRGRIILRIAEELRSHSGRNASLKEAANRAGYSRFHFLRLFKHYTGRTFLDYVDQCRIDRLQVLQEQQLSRSQVAEMLGFSCSQSLARWLRQRRIVGN